MTILLNLSNNIYIDIDKSIESFDIVLSPYKFLEYKNGQKSGHKINFASIFGASILMNQYFWILNLRRDVQRLDEKISKIIIYHGEDKKNLDVYSDIKSIEIKNKYIIVHDIEYIRIPTYSFYDKNHLHHVEKYLEVWLWFLLMKETRGNKPLDEVFTKNTKVKSFYKKIIGKPRFINGGNEGALYWSEDYSKINKIIKKDFKPSNNLKEIYDRNNVTHSPDDYIEEFYKDSRLNVKIKIDGEDKIFVYNNIVSPVSDLSFVQIARLLIRQRLIDVFIDDNKVINYGKIKFKDSPFFETIYNDFGNSFVKTDNDDFKKGIIRDVYFLVRNQQKDNHRMIIRSKRLEGEADLFNDKKYERFYNFVVEKYRIMPMICHDLSVSQNIDTYDVVYTCENVDTMNRLIKQEGGKKFVYEMHNNLVHECSSIIPNKKFIKHERVKELSPELEFIDGATRWIRK